MNNKETPGQFRRYWGSSAARFRRFGSLLVGYAPLKSPNNGGDLLFVCDYFINTNNKNTPLNFSRAGNGVLREGRTANCEV